LEKKLGNLYQWARKISRMTLVNGHLRPILTVLRPLLNTTVSIPLTKMRELGIVHGELAMLHGLGPVLQLREGVAAVIICTSIRT
jgi:hypothetical protein